MEYLISFSILLLGISNFMNAYQIHRNNKKIDLLNKFDTEVVTTFNQIYSSLIGLKEKQIAQNQRIVDHLEYHEKITENKL